jgi:N-acetylglucosamine kinase-like BadF-type ATPase
MKFVIGLDGGGSKTACLLADLKGNELGEGRGGSSSLTHRSESEVRKAIADALEAALKAATLKESDRSNCVAVCGGFAGAGRASTDPQLEAILRDLLPSARVQVVPDYRIAFEAATQGRPGVVVIAGTGSIVYGRNAAGRECRIGGWGPDVSDEGSGFAIGREAVSAVMKACDGRLPPTTLRERVLAAWSVEDEEGLIERMRLDLAAGRRPSFAPLLREVVEAALAGDKVANTILERAATTLAEMAMHVGNRLKLKRGAVRAIGGVIHNSPQVQTIFTLTLLDRMPGAEIESAMHAPVEGAVRMALALAKSANEGAARLIQ